jgi:protein transport protein SEC23
MIRPQLKSYSLKKQPELVKADVTSLKHDRILILDNFYSVVVWYGAKIAKCRKLGYHKYIKFKDLKKLLQMTNAYAKVLIEKRFPNPPLIHCDQNKSKARHLLVRLNPTTNQWNKEFITDEASIDVFLEELIRKLTI